MDSSVGICPLVVSAATTTAYADSGNLIANPNFVGSSAENCYCAINNWVFSTANPGYFEDEYNNTGSSLSGQGFWDNGTVPVGITTVGTIQVGQPPGPLATNFLTQTLTSLTVGTNYAISFLENARSAASNGSPFSVQVLVGGKLAVQSLDSVVGGSNSFRTETGMFQATSSAEVFEFFVIGNNGDETALLTDVSVTDVPEPQTISVFAIGITGIAYARRKMYQRKP